MFSYECYFIKVWFYLKKIKKTSRNRCNHYSISKCVELPASLFIISETLRGCGRQTSRPELETTLYSTVYTLTAGMFYSNVIPISHSKTNETLVYYSVLLLRVLWCGECWDVVRQWLSADNSSKSTGGTVRSSKWTLKEAVIAEAGSAKERTQILPIPNHLHKPSLLLFWCRKKGCM